MVTSDQSTDVMLSFMNGLFGIRQYICIVGVVFAYKIILHNFIGITQASRDIIQYMQTVIH